MKFQRSLPAEASVKATYQDVLGAPPNMVAEILDGTLYTLPRPAGRHTWASAVMGGRIGTPLSWGPGGPGGWWIVPEPELHFNDDDDILVPDLAGWRKERMPRYPAGPYVVMAPDWACEVLSPSTRQMDLGYKRRVYAREGVGHLWFVDPDARTLEAFELLDGKWSPVGTVAGKGTVCLPPFEAISFPLEALWLEEAGTAED